MPVLALRDLGGGIGVTTPDPIGEAGSRTSCEDERTAGEDGRPVAEVFSHDGGMAEFCEFLATDPAMSDVVLLTMLRKYEPSAGLGTVMARMIPFVVPFWVVWVLILTLFYVLDLPLGPGVGIMIGD